LRHDFAVTTKTCGSSKRYAESDIALAAQAGNEPISADNRVGKPQRKSVGNCVYLVNASRNQRAREGMLYNVNAVQFDPVDTASIGRIDMRHLGQLTGYV
jgi:hypothetical protein